MNGDKIEELITLHLNWELSIARMDERKSSYITLDIDKYLLELIAIHVEEELAVGD